MTAIAGSAPCWPTSAPPSPTANHLAWASGRCPRGSRTTEVQGAGGAPADTVVVGLTAPSAAWTVARTVTEVASGLTGAVSSLLPAGNPPTVGAGGSCPF